LVVIRPQSLGAFAPAEAQAFESIPARVMGSVMRARQLITASGTIHGPETLRVIIKAFDSAWADLAPSISGEAQACQLKLATIILVEANQERRDANAL
jgi:hypothetical protein